jgi:phenylacetate-CoA ligase
MKDMKTTVLACTPSYAVYLGEAALQEGYDPSRDFKLRVGMFGAEPWSEESRRSIEETLGLRSHNVYGLSEIYGPGVGIECEKRCGLHVWGDHIITEVLNPDTGEEVKPGELGELTFTTLTRESLPMLRYRTRDLARVSTEPCECGLHTVRILEIRGRSDDMLIIGGVNVFPSQVETVLLAVPGIGEQYEIIVDRKKTLTRLHVRVEVAGDFGGSKDELEALRSEASTRLQSGLGINAKLELEEPGTLTRYEGKAQRVKYVD